MKNQPEDAALAARLSALELIVESLLSHQLAVCSREESLMIKADLLRAAGYRSAEPLFDVSEATRSEAAMHVEGMLDAAAAQESRLRNTGPESGNATVPFRSRARVS